MKLIAITGLRGHGKTTAAMALEAQGYRHINFADGVKEVCELVYGIPMAVLQDPVLKEKPLKVYPFASPREVMQQVGTEMFRAYKDDTWVQMFRRRCGDWSHIVCSDLRFPNEADTVRALGGTIIRIDDPRKRRRITDIAGQHASETSIELIEPDWTITNDGTIAELQAQVEGICL